ncbi:MAG TPA: thiamine pyrophosphate-dependent dehydrogenase E1 component subunit alpha, partial [Acidobacteriota bacterium]
GKKMVALTYIGDGGTSTGDFHEGLNFASVHHLPFICVIENNQYAYSTPVQKQANVKDLVERAKAYGMPGGIVDGNDVLAVYELTRQARDLCLKGDGPFLMECKTFRIKGHAEHDDPAKYVPKEHFEEWRKKDPIDRHTNFVLDRKLMIREEIDSMKQEIEQKLEIARKEALESPFPPAEDATKGVFQ